MTRARALLAAVVAALVAGTAIVVPASEGESSYEIDVVFDDSRGLLVGQLVQIAGARVGEIKDVSVTGDYKARIHMEVDRRFAPFREDARCTIKPSGLIAENYVQCDPGTADAPPLEAKGDTAPTVPVENTTQPVSLTDLFDTWNTPTQQRLGVLLSTLGIATSGRGEDLNEVLRRMNPSLALARRVIGMLEDQREELATIVDASDEVVAELAREPEHLEGLVRHASRVLSETASERGALAEGVQRLPGLLEAAQPALRKLDALSAAAEPLVDRVGEAAPTLNRLTADIPVLGDAAAPTLKALGPVLRRGGAIARRAAPVTSLVRTYSAESLPSTAIAAEMFPTLEERDFGKNLNAFFYNAAMASARYDADGHIIPAHVTLTPCGVYATTPDPDCGAPEAAPARDAPTRRPRQDEGGDRDAAPAPRDEDSQGPAPRDEAAPQRPERPRLPELPRLPRPDVPELPPLPDLEDLPRILDPEQLDQLRDPEGREPDPETVQDLLDFLLG